MTKSIGEIAARLAAERDIVRKKKQRLSTADIEEMLLRFLKGDEEGSASRLAAAKILLERFGATTREDNDAKKRERQERAEAEAEAQALLAELAAAKLAGVPGPRALDKDGEGGATDAAAANGRGEE